MKEGLWGVVAGGILKLSPRLERDKVLGMKVQQRLYLFKKKKKKVQGGPFIHCNKMGMVGDIKVLFVAH